MKNIVAILIFATLPLQLLSQFNYKKGYIIDNSGKRYECELLSSDNEEKGEDYLYRLTKHNKSKKVNVEQVKEFGINDQYRFVRKKVKLDISNGVVKRKEDIEKSATYQEGAVFLLELVKSDVVSLYYFLYEGKEFFFYKMNDGVTRLLIYKRYTVEVASGLASEYYYDNTFKKQLEVDLKCTIDLKTVSYEKESLVDYILTYIKEKGKIAEQVKELDPAKLNFKLSASYNNLGFYLFKDKISGYDFGNTNDYSFGAEIEYLFSFNKNKFGVFTELNYNQFSNEFKHNGDVEPDVNTVNPISEIDYKYLSLPIGVVYNFRLSSIAKVFVKAAIVPSFSISDSRINIYNKFNTYEIPNTVYSRFSAGFSVGPVNFEYGYYPSRNITKNTKESEFDQMNFKLSVDVLKFDL
jgi:hypothetical protein